MQELVESIDFDVDNGVLLSMLNDVSRNQFYDKMLTEVRGKDCLEIGFGTGLLSLLALKHGARSIIAYESDTVRFHLGNHIIKLLKLQDRITLLNKLYDHTCDHDVDVVFHETLCANIWGEGLYNSFPRKPGKKFLPGQYFLKLHAVPISTEFAISLAQSHEKNYFAPGVEIDTKFVSYINLLLAKKYSKPISRQTKLPTGVIELSPQLSYTHWITDDTCVAQYMIDANAPFENISIKKFQIDIKDQPVLVIPRTGIQHGNDCLYLDIGHWKLPSNPVIINLPNCKAVVEHEFSTGKITYKLEDLV